MRSCRTASSEEVSTFGPFFTFTFFTPLRACSGCCSGFSATTAVLPGLQGQPEDHNMRGVPLPALVTEDTEMTTCALMTGYIWDRHVPGMWPGMCARGS